MPILMTILLILMTILSQFGAVYYNSDEDTASVSAFETMLKNYKSSDSCDNVINGFTAKLIEKCVNDLKLGKARRAVCGAY